MSGNIKRKKTAIVTGAYGMIGKAIAETIALDSDFEVICIGRNENELIRAMLDIKRKTGNSSINYQVVELSNKESISRFSKEWGRPLNVLVNNAATTPRERLETSNGIEVQFATNVLGYMWMMQGLNEYMRGINAARIVNVASYWAGDMDIDDLEFKHRRYNNDTAYRQSKQADRMLTVKFANLYEQYGITVNSCHPGDVNSKLSNNLGYGGHETPIQGAQTPAWLALSDEVQGITGRYFSGKQESHCAFAKNKQLIEKLYKICVQY